MARVTAPREAVNRVVLIAITTLTLLFVFLVSRTFFRTQPVATGATVAPVATALRAHQLELDSDKDGVPDWEELLHSTDPQDSKSFSNREAGIASTLPITTENGKDVATLTATDMVAQELMGTFLQKYGEGVSMTQETQESLVDEALAKLNNTVTAPTFLASAVNTMPATNENKKMYIQNMGKIIENASAESPAEYHALSYIIQGSNKKGVEMLQHAVSVYDHSIDAMKNISTPEDVKEIHAALVSGFIAYRTAFSQIAQLEQDPVLATIGLSTFSKAQTTMAGALQDYALYVLLFYQSMGVLPEEVVKKMRQQ